MVTLSELFRGAVESLSARGIEEARFEAECLLQKAADIDRLRLLTEPQHPVDEHGLAVFSELLKRRISGEPLQYILGEWEFYGLPFRVGDGVLIPRQDTETLVELALEYSPQNKLCADLCAGSGCVGISLAKQSGCTVHSYELSEKAFSYLRQNVELNAVSDKVKPIFADVLSEETLNAAPMYDIIVSNPPYLTAQDMSELQTEVAHEPKMALYGGEDGLDFYRSMMALWTNRLKQGGLFAVEIGITQEDDVIRIFRENGLEADCRKDMCGVYRVVFGRKK